VKLASERRVPVIPVSSGPPRFQGDTVPCQGGIIVDFSRMKRICKIDPINRYVMIEPGVTYSELLPEVEKQGLKLNIPLLPKPNKSVITSRLEREPVLIPKYHYDTTDPLLTLEVIYGTGEDFRTGSASGPGTLETLKADKVNPWGPGPVDYARFVSGAQGTLGLVTWAITKAEVLPSLQELYFIPGEEVDKLAMVMNLLLRKRVVDECLILNNVNLASILAEVWPEDYKELKNKLPAWTVITCIAGYRLRPEERVSIMTKYLNEICADSGLKPLKGLPGAGGKEVRLLKMLSSEWDKKPYWKIRGKGSCRDVFFLTTLSNVAKFVKLMNSIISGYRYPGEDIGCYIQPVTQGRGCHCEFNLPCDETNSEELAVVKQLFRNASETLMENGAFFSRPYGGWSEMVYRRYPEGAEATRKLKAIFDPNNILNPGKLCF
jgi:hypothetical protein